MKFSRVTRATLVAAALAGCDDPPTRVEVDEGRPASTLVVSNPTTTSAAAGSARGASSAAQTDVVYVSLVPGTVPNGGIATITNPRTEGPVYAAMMAGGFDPVPVAAQPGDALTIEVQVGGGGAPVLLSHTVPARRRPIIVRIDPPPRKRDVPLNAAIAIVFSEPVQAHTLSGIQLLRGGAPLSGRVTLSADGLRAMFQPDANLEPNAAHEVLVSADVRDLSGDALEQTVTTEFTTGTTTALATVATAEAALFVNPNTGTPRAISFDAVLHNDGSVTGTYHLFYPENGLHTYGTVVCVATVGNAAWVAGVADSSTNSTIVGLERGWRLVDHGPAGDGGPDQLSLAHPLVEGGVSSAQEWCATTPEIDPWFGDIVLHDLVGGDVVVTGEAPPGPVTPKPPVPNPGDGMSQIAFATTEAGGGIAVIHPDGSGLRRLTFGNDWNPAWSPDGTRIAFQRDGSDIYVVNWDGSGLAQVTDGPDLDVDPAWSPDGTRIAFVRNGRIHVMNADGSEIAALSSADGDLHPTWSPDGARIAFTSSRSNAIAIHVMNADGSGVVQLTSDSAYDFSPSWSPDDQRIVFHREPSGVGSVQVMNPDGTDRTRVVGGHTPSWAPDGRRIVYELFGTMFFAMADGSGMTRLGLVPHGGAFAPAWSPVGTMPPEPTPFRSIEEHGGDGQSGAPGETLGQPLSVRVVRDNGTPEAGVTVRWNWWEPSTSRTWSISSHLTTTDVAGIASVSMIVGSAPEARVVAVLSDGTARVGEVWFSATAATVAGAPVGIERTNWRVLDTLLVADSTYEHTVVAYDHDGHPVSGVQVVWQLQIGEGSITPEVDTTRYDPRFDRPASSAFRIVGPTEGTTTVTATAPTIPGAPEVRFTSTVVSARVPVVCNGFSIDTVTVASGRSVGWVWRTGCHRFAASHNVTFEDDPTEPTSSPTIRGIGQFIRTFDGEPRTIRYRCTLHSTDFQGPAREVGVVIVQP